MDVQNRQAAAETDVLLIESDRVSVATTGWTGIMEIHTRVGLWPTHA